MANQAKKVSAQNITTTLSANDRVVVLANTAGNVYLGTITTHNLTLNLVKGAYANDSVANSAGVLVGGLYYDSTGAVHVRLT